MSLISKAEVIANFSRVKFHGGTFSFGPPDPMQPAGSGAHVICDRHPRQIIPVTLNFLEASVLSIKEAAEEALKKCVECVQEYEEKSSWKNTRWPDAGNTTGGAEL